MPSLALLASHQPEQNRPSSDVLVRKQSKDASTVVYVTIANNANVYLFLSSSLPRIRIQRDLLFNLTLEPFQHRRFVGVL